MCLEREREMDLFSTRGDVEGLGATRMAAEEAADEAARQLENELKKRRLMRARFLGRMVAFFLLAGVVLLVLSPVYSVEARNGAVAFGNWFFGLFETSGKPNVDKHRADGGK
eukprot:GDKI01033194.1.p1 GENE.GDKI01033194.1~~GDKI01033194.1.p1  ORF type:complete len:112 (-),score=31.10 GDKI01033194.1:173-508(-)